MFTATGGIDDLFGLDDSHSIARLQFTQSIQLKDYDVPIFIPDETYITKVIGIPRHRSPLDFLDIITGICKKAEYTGKHEKFHAGVHEAVRNAHQHGNKKNPRKKIYISYRVTADAFEVVIGDEGGILNPHFVPFVLRHREGMNTPFDFYKFAPAAHKKPENAGVGTYVIHTVSDEVQYLKNQQGGLSVRMIIRKET